MTWLVTRVDCRMLLVCSVALAIAACSETPQFADARTGNNTFADANAGGPDAEVPDGTPPEPDAGDPDAGDPDAGDPDAGDPDAGDPDASPPDAAPLLCVTDLVPTMTSATAPSGVVTRSGVYSGAYEAWQAFGDSPSSMWISAEGQTPAWIAYEWAEGRRTITSYAIQFVNGTLTSRAPRDWTFEGFDGEGWVVVDQRAQEIDWLGVERREYQVATPGAYAGYRLVVTDDNDARAGVVVISFRRLELIGTEVCEEPER